MKSNSGKTIKMRTNYINKQNVLKDALIEGKS